MSKYSAARTVWKALWTWAQTIGVVGAADVLAVEWPEDATAERVIVYCLTVLPAIWRALENWRKNSGPGGLPRWEWRDLLVWLQDKLGLTLLVLLLAGCATAQTEARISQTDPDGFTESVEFKTSGVVTWGSSQDLQRGDLDYTWGEGEHFKAGGSATNQQAADPVTDILVRLVERLMPPPPVVVPEPEPEPTIEEIAP